MSLTLIALVSCKKHRLVTPILSIIITITLIINYLQVYSSSSFDIWHLKLFTVLQFTHVSTVSQSEFHSFITLKSLTLLLNENSYLKPHSVVRFITGVQVLCNGQTL